MMLLWSRTVQSCRCQACSKALGRRATPAPRRKVTAGDVFTACYSAIFATATLADVARKRERRDQWDRAIEEVRSQLTETGDGDRISDSQGCEMKRASERRTLDTIEPERADNGQHTTACAPLRFQTKGGLWSGMPVSNQAVAPQTTQSLYHARKAHQKASINSMPHRSFHTTAPVEQEEAVFQLTPHSLYRPLAEESGGMLLGSVEDHKPALPVSLTDSTASISQEVTMPLRPEEQAISPSEDPHVNVHSHAFIEPVEYDYQLVRFSPTERLEKTREGDFNHAQATEQDSLLDQHPNVSMMETSIRTLVRKLVAATCRSGEDNMSMEAQNLIKQVKSLQMGATEYPYHRSDRNAEDDGTKLHQALETLLAKAKSSPTDVELMIAKICFNLLVASVPPRKETVNSLLQNFAVNGLHHQSRILIKCLFYDGPDCLGQYMPDMHTLALMLDHFAAVGDAHGFVSLTKRMRGGGGGLLRRFRFQKPQNLDVIRTVKSGKFIGDGMGFVEKTPRNDAMFDSLILGSLRLGRLKAASRYFRSALREGCDVTAKALLWLVSSCVADLDHSTGFRIIHAIVCQWRDCSFQSVLPMFPRVQWHFEVLLSLCRANYALLNVNSRFITMLNDFERYLRLETIDNALGLCSQKLLALEEALLPTAQSTTPDSELIKPEGPSVPEEQQSLSPFINQEEFQQRLSLAVTTFPQRSAIAYLIDRNRRLANFCRDLWLSVFELKVAQFEDTNRLLKIDIRICRINVIERQLAHIESNVESLKESIIHLRWAFDLRQASDPQYLRDIYRQQIEAFGQEMKRKERHKFILQKRILEKLEKLRKTPRKHERPTLVRKVAVLETRMLPSVVFPKKTPVWKKHAEQFLGSYGVEDGQC